MLEDFLTYEEEDPWDKITVSENEIVVDEIELIDHAYVMKNMGLDAFEDFEHLVEVLMSAPPVGGFGSNVWALTNVSTSYIRMRQNNDGMCIFFVAQGPIMYMMDRVSGTSTNSVKLDYDVPYYLTIKRTGTTLECWIYNDALRTDEKDYMSIVCDPIGYQYVFGYMNEEGHTDRYWIGYVKDLDLQMGCEQYGNKTDCEAAGCFWWNGECHELEPTCEEILNQTDCEAYQCFWYNGSCHAVAPVCDELLNQTDCEAYQCFWYNGSCHNVAPTCEEILNPTECGIYNCFWYNGSCHSVAPVCDELLNQTDCEAYQCFWYNGSCHELEPTCEELLEETECVAYECFWYDGACHSEPKPEGQANIVDMYSVPANPDPNVPFSLYVHIENVGDEDTIWLDVYKNNESEPFYNQSWNLLNGEGRLVVISETIADETTYRAEAGHMEYAINVLDDSLELVVTPSPQPCANPIGIHGQADPCGDGGTNQPLTTYQYLCNDGVWEQQDENCPFCPDCVVSQEIPWTIIAIAGAVSVTTIGIAALLIKRKK